MPILNNIIFSSLVVTAFAALPAMTAIAEEMDHSHMHGDQHQSTPMPADNSSHEVMNHNMHMEPAQNENAMPSDHRHHDGHGMLTNQSSMSSKISLKPLSQPPASGKAREAGYDGRYAMENTSIELPQSDKCALASRGMVMFDKASLSLCGGKFSNSTLEPSKPDNHEHHQM